MFFQTVLLRIHDARKLEEENTLIKFCHSDKQSSTGVGVMSQLPSAFPRENNQKLEKLFKKIKIQINTKIIKISLKNISFLEILKLFSFEN